MARPRSKEYKDLPEGLRFVKNRGTYRFYRVDGTTISLGKDKVRAIKLAKRYNATYRIDPLLAHPIEQEGKPKPGTTAARKYLELREVLPKVIDQICEDKDWSENYEINQRNAFKHILDFFGDYCGNEIDIDKVNAFLEQRDGNASATKEQYNRRLGHLNLVFDYLVSDSFLIENPAKLKVRKTIRQKDEETIRRLTWDMVRDIHQLAGQKRLHWLQIAIELAIQTCQGVLEISRIKYDHIDEHLKIRRQKNQRTAASRVAIPINDELQAIVERSKQDGIKSPFVVHYQRDKRYRNRPLGKGMEHETQLASQKISRTFSDLRDELGFFKEVKVRDERPGFHDIRSLSITWLENNNYDAQKRAAHAERQSTDTYKKGHVQWNEVPDKVVEWRE